MSTRRTFLAGTLMATGAVLAHGANAESRRRIPLAFLGAGYSHFAGKLAVASESEDFEVIGVCEEDATVRNRTPPAPRWISFQELADRSEVVVVESGVPRHASDALRALEAGKHVHLEKPPADTLAAFDRLQQAAARRNRLLQIGYMWRFNPGLQALLDAGRSGVFGDIFKVQATMNTLASPEARGEWAAFPGGAMFEQGCHLIDAVVRLLGRPDRVTPFRQELGRPKDSLADNTLAILEYPRALAVVASAPRQPNAGPHRSVEVTGTRGTGILQPLEPPRLILDVADTDGATTTRRREVPLRSYRRYVDDFAALAAAIRNRQPLEVSPETERCVQETVLRACGMI